MNADRDTDLLALLHDVARMMRTRADQRARLKGMTRAQWVILGWLERRPGISQHELATLVEVEPITIARLIDRLEAHRLVERRADPNDRRVRRLHLVAGAKPLLKEIKAYRAELLAVVTAGVEPDMLKATIGALRIMKTNILEELRDAKKAV